MMPQCRIAVASFVGLTALACAAGTPPPPTPTASAPGVVSHAARFSGVVSGEEYAAISENGFRSVSSHPLSTFALDVDRASYSNVRRFIELGQRPPIDAVRVEELINYFHFEYPGPEGHAPLAISSELSAAPWNPEHYLARIGIRAAPLDLTTAPSANLVFLIDRSGSMGGPNRLDLVKSSLRLLVEQLRPEDRVAVVVYASRADVALRSTSGRNKKRILDVIDALHAEGSTAGGAGLDLAYQVARENFKKGGNNRIILVSDGDFNVGPSDVTDLIRLVEEQRDSGVFLTVLGFGMGNLKDAKMEALADHGNGTYGYIDNVIEGRRFFVEELGATMYTIAKDVKAQVEFNPAYVQSYRLIGYENRLLAPEAFNDSTTDAGDLGAGHVVTALYEIVPVGITPPNTVGTVDPLRYQSEPGLSRQAAVGELMNVRVRAVATPAGTPFELNHPVRYGVDPPSPDGQFASAVASFAMLLRDSQFANGISLDSVVALGQRGRGEDLGGYRSEFIKLVEVVRDLRLLESAGSR